MGVCIFCGKSTTRKGLCAKCHKMSEDGKKKFDRAHKSKTGYKLHEGIRRQYR